MKLFNETDIKESIRLVLQDWLDNEHGTIVREQDIEEYFNKVAKWKSERDKELTPELLDLCGLTRFDDEYDGVKVWSKSLIEIAQKDGKFYLHSSCTDPWYNQCIGEPIVYLHQLQNLYFALTGEELNVKL